MRIAIIGRTEILYDSAVELRRRGHEITCMLTAREAPEYSRTAADFRRLSSEWGIPFAQGGRISAHREFLKESKSDIAVSINYTGVVPDEIVDIFPSGILNAHGGDLPRYRGNACQSWAIINGESRVGLCIHKMIGGELDSGDIVSRDYFPLDMSTKITAVWKWMASRTPGLMADAVDRLADDVDYVLERQSTDPRSALRCYPRRPEDGRVDWSKSATAIIRLINASNRPYSGAFCDLAGAKLTIWDAELVTDGEVFCAVPGQITKISAEYVEVACGEGKVRLREVEVGATLGRPVHWITSLRDRLS